jgi:hypothetical protein
MKPEELLKSITDMAEALRSDMASQIGKLHEKCDALSDSVKRLDAKRNDDDSDDDYGPGGNPDATLPKRVAADSVDPAAFAALKSRVDDMRRRQSRPMADLNAFADAQAKADAVVRNFNERAEPPMAGEDLVAYQIRMHRKLQPHSAKWKGVELGIIAPDRVALDNVLAEIRSDAMAASLKTDGMPMFRHREIVKQMPGGHLVRSFIGNGTFIKQLSRPVRHVAYIGPRFAPQ